MFSILVKSATSIVLKMLATAASKELLEWVLFKAAEAYTKSTKTEWDDTGLRKFKETYYTINKDKVKYDKE